MTGGYDSQGPLLPHPIQSAIGHVTAAVGERVAAAGGEDPTGGGPWSSGSSVP
jgi:hypothetical protein